MAVDTFMSAIEVEGMEEYLALLDLNYKQMDRICGRSIYPGAKLIANDCKKRLINLQTDDSLFSIASKYDRLLRGPTKRQKQGLIESMGIASMRKHGGTFDVKLGFDGYNDVPSTTAKKGFQPNALIARSVNKGTSFMVAQPFMDQSIEVCRKPVEGAIEEQFYKELEKIWDKYFSR